MNGTSLTVKEFMSGSWKKEETSKSFIFIPIPTFSDLFLNTPVISLIGLGALLVGASLYEKKLVKEGREYEAERISLLVGIGLPTVAIGGAIYVILGATKLLF